VAQPTHAKTPQTNEQRVIKNHGAQKSEAKLQPVAGHFPNENPVAKNMACNRIEPM
jgi:hypothetical protein